MSKHAKQRGFERYGLMIDDGDIAEIVRQIEMDEARFIRESRTGASIYEATVKGEAVFPVVGWRNGRMVITTLLSRKMADASEFYAKRLARKARKKGLFAEIEGANYGAN